MIKLTLKEIQKVLDAKILNYNDLYIENICFDSRNSTPNNLFIPLIDQNDGHNFINNAINNGSIITLWQLDHIDTAPTNIPVVLVENTLNALQQLSKFYLKKINPKIVAISGSNGKTTTKDLLASMCMSNYTVFKTQSNFNNEIGVPFTILSMPLDTNLLIIELGMDHPGDLKKLSSLVNPDIAILTMIGEAHLEFFNSRKEIALNKLEITYGMPTNSTLIYNGDEPLLTDNIHKTNINNTISFGLNKSNDIFATNITFNTHNTYFNISSTDDTISIPLIGSYNVSNALAAISAASLLNVDFKTIINNLKQVIITENRTQWLTGNFGGEIISDVYNSNPTAVKEVLNTFNNLSTSHNKSIVLGDMLELGNKSIELHTALSDLINPKLFNQIYLIGPLMESLYKSLISKYSSNNIKWYNSSEKSKLKNDINIDLNNNDILLIKGSHGMHLEELL